MHSDPLEPDVFLTPAQQAEHTRRQNIGRVPQPRHPLDDALRLEKHIQSLPSWRLRAFDRERTSIPTIEEACRILDAMKFCPMCGRPLQRTALQQRSTVCLEHVLYYIDGAEDGGYEFWFILLS